MEAKDIAAYQSIRVEYASGQPEDVLLPWTTAPTPVNPNLRVVGKELQADSFGQINEDWTGPYVGVGPDGFKDVKIHLTNLSAGADCHVTVTANTLNNGTIIWESGLNPNGRLNAELLNRTGLGVNFGTSADLVFSTATGVDLAGASLQIVVAYERDNPDNPAIPDPHNKLTNREGKFDTVNYTVPSTIHTPFVAMSAVTVSNLPQVRATSLDQEPSSPGNSRVQLDAGSLPSGKSLASAILSDDHGSNWTYGTVPYIGGGASPLEMQYNDGVFYFPPVRDEEGSILTLLLTFTDGSQAVARFVGKPSDIGRRVADTRVGATSFDVSSAASLLTALGNSKPNIRLKAGTYTLTQPLTLSYPVRITADPGITLNFVLGSAWNTKSAAIVVSSSHVSLDGFSIRFQGNSGSWTASDRVVIGSNTSNPQNGHVDLSFTHLDIQAPAAAVSAPNYEPAIDLMRLGAGDSGRIANNVLKGGGIWLRVGPWKVLDNDYQGTVANTIAHGFLYVDDRSHDLTISGNQAHPVAPAGVTQRFLIMGQADKGQGIGNLIENNKIYGGFGTIQESQLAKEYKNSPEIIVLETYQPRFEGKPLAVSPDGFIVQVVQQPSYLRGPAARTGDVVSIVSGSDAGQWRMIVQAIDSTRYLLDEPLPQGDYKITIGRGFVNQTFRGNTIDVSNKTDVDNIGLLISGNDWGTRIIDNRFIGDLGNANLKGDTGLRIVAGSSQEGFATQGVPQQLAPWGWSRLPVFDLAIDGNVLTNSMVNLMVAHGEKNKANSERTYLSGSFTNNELSWSDGAKPAVTIGVAANSDTIHYIPHDYTKSRYDWLSLDEIRLTTQNSNWGRNPTTGAAATMKVFAATINGSGVNNPDASPLPTAATVTAASHGQDGSDYVGASGAIGPDGRQDVHIVLTGLSANKTISQIQITGYGGGDWRLTGTTAPYSLVLFRHGTTADVYLQPYQNEDGGRYFTVGVQYTDTTWVYPTVPAIYADFRLAALANRSPAGGTITARGENAAAGEGKAQAFDGNPLTKWLDYSGTSWIQYQFAGGAAQVITQYTITSANDTATFPERAPRDWTLKGSNDGVNWTILDVRTNEANTSNLTPRTYRFSNSTAYKYYKLDDIVSNGLPVIQIGEIQLQSPQVLAIRSGSTTAVGSFQGEGYAFGGSGYTTTHAIDLSGAINPAPEAVYQVERFADSFNYQIPGLTPGYNYTVRLHFSENTATAAGQRTFNIGINTTWVLNNFDIFAAAGGMYKAVVREFTATASASGYITVVFDGTGQPGDAKVNGIEIVAPAVDLARGKAATSSADESATYAAGKAVDGNATTRWSSGQWMRNNSVGWITIDLGAVFDIDRIRLNWEAAFAVDYMIQVSDDGNDWTTVKSVVGNTSSGVADYSNLSARGRYVRIYCTKLNATSNYSLYELNVYGA